MIISSAFKRTAQPPVHIDTVAQVSTQTTSTMLAPLNRLHKAPLPSQTSLLPSTYYPTKSFPNQFPLEVEENIIDQLCDDVKSLRSCALTCQTWHARSRFHLFRVIGICNDDGRTLIELCSFLDRHMVCRELVQSLVVYSEQYSLWDAEQSDRANTLPFTNLICTPLLMRLPNLRRCELSCPTLWFLHESATFHPSMFIYLRTHSKIETLCLHYVSFSGPTMLIGLVNSLPMLRHLELNGVNVNMKSDLSQIVKYDSTVRRMGSKLHSLAVSMN